jgi:glycerol-3-phosphate acyltransferase PlsY
MRLTSPRIGTVVVFIDGLKGLIAWGVAYLILLGNGWALPIAGTMAVIGHCWPIYTRFHGGMGLATGGGLILVTSPLSLVFIIPLWAFFFLAVFKKAYSPRSVLLALLIGIPLRLWLLPSELYGRWFLISVGLILIIRHLSDWNRQI